MRDCMVKWEDDQLPDAMDALWKSLVHNFKDHDPSDDWHDCDKDPKNEMCVYDPVKTPFQMRWLEF